MKYWIKLTRPVNLLIIALTMYLLHWVNLQASENLPPYPLWKFHLVVLVMVTLAAAGNIINDYFDLRVDRINKPEKVLIGKFVKRRVAMISHQFLNALAVILGLWLAYDIGNFWLGIIPIVIASLLWVYSIALKKKVLIGNWTIALLIAMVPLYAGGFDLVHSLAVDSKVSTFQEFFSFTFSAIFIYAISLSFALFGFLLTLIREAQKDLEDLKGDTQVGYQTLPIRYGIKKTKFYIGVLFFITIFSIFVFALLIFPNIELLQSLIIHAAVGLSVVVILVFSWWFTAKAKDKEGFHHAGDLTKVAMVLGLIFLALVGAWFK